MRSKIKGSKQERLVTILKAINRLTTAYVRSMADSDFELLRKIVADNRLVLSPDSACFHFYNEGVIEDCTPVLRKRK